MISNKLKSLIDEYCMGVTPSDEQMDSIMDLAIMLNEDSAEVAKYIKKRINGPDKEEYEKKKKKDAEYRRKAAAERAQKAAELESQILNYSGSYIDLGLSVKWATCNVGAQNPWDIGDYFAWGETKSKAIYTWSTYALCNGTKESLTAYCKEDGICRLASKDDVATVSNEDKWKFWKKNRWRMPTEEEYEELLSCKFYWTTIKGQEGCVFIGKNGNGVFLPSSGTCEGEKRKYYDGCYYWLSSRVSPYLHSYEACCMGLSKKRGLERCNIKVTSRCFGLPVRAIYED